MKGCSVLIVLFLLATSLNAQTWDCRIYGTIRKSSGEAKENCTIVIFRNEDTICKTSTNQTGNFDLSVPFASGNNYTLLYESFENAEKVILYRKTDSIPRLSYLLNLTLRNIKWDKFDNSAYYELNETSVYQNFDLKFLKHSLIENPGVCVEFIQTWNPEEKKKVARKRMKIFRNQLLEAGINPKQVSFSKQIMDLSQEETSESRSRIEGVVVSLEGACR